MSQSAIQFEPLETGITAALTALLFHLIMPASSNIRRTDGEWPWLDPYRSGHPSEYGWPTYLGAGLFVALAVGLLTGGAHWIAWRSVSQRRARQLLGWGFTLMAATAGFFAPLFMHRFPRVPDRPSPTLRRPPEPRGLPAPVVKRPQ